MTQTTNASSPLTPRPLDAAMRKLVDRHFKGALNADQTRQMHAALDESDALRDYFARRQLIARTDPKGLSAKERIGQSLGLAPKQKKPLALTLLAPALGLSAAAAVLLVVVAPLGSTGTDDGFTARGGDAKLAALSIEEVRVFEVGGAEPQRIGRQVKAGAELAFAYRNPKAHPYLMIFGVDDGGDVYWYYPAWTDPAQNPQAVKAERTSRLIELNEAVAHDVSGQRLRIYSYFLDRPATVQDVERELSARGPGPQMQLVADVGVVR